MDWQRQFGLKEEGGNASYDREQMLRYINLKLATLGLPTYGKRKDLEFLDLAQGLLASYQERVRLLSSHLCPADQRLQAFLDRELRGLILGGPVRLPAVALELDRHGMARELSLPLQGDVYHNAYLSSYRLTNGVLHNPRHDRRTTQGVFHIAEGGMPIPADKKAVPLAVFGRLLRLALNPPAEVLRLPFCSGQEQALETFVSLLLRPLVCPGVAGVMPELRMEVRFFAPGCLVSNLDFVESIFGNRGDPHLPANDAGLDPEHWTGHTGCVILAPHLDQHTKKELGLPHWRDASERQRRDGMCWREEGERYNEGQAFKVTHRTSDGIMVTLIADNYFGYCKKEVKTQISFSANLFGLAEEEHAGGALAFASYHLGDQFKPEKLKVDGGHCFSEVRERCGPLMELQAEGYGIDRRYPEILYMPEDLEIDINEQTVSWTGEGLRRTMRLLPNRIYFHPSGFRLQVERHPGAPSWRLVGTRPEGVFCHKPCTVSGGGKSEISKSVVDAMHFGPIFVRDFQEDMDLLERLFARDYGDRFTPQSRPDYSARGSRAVLSEERSLGSVIKMFTPSAGDFTAEYDAWLRSIPEHIWPLVFIIKRFYRPQWGDHWRAHFKVDCINGSSGHELKYLERKLVGCYLRVGLNPDGSWRTFKLRQDFIAAKKLQMEDDISASVVLPAGGLGPLPPEFAGRSVKLVANCEARLFQRPDDAIHRGYDKQAEKDIASPGLFCSNYEPLSGAQLAGEVQDIMKFENYSPRLKRRLRRAARQQRRYVVSTAHPRLVDGKPCKNPRYLQVAPDLEVPRNRYLAEVATRLHRRLPAEATVHFPVDAILTGRRNNPPEKEKGIKSLAVYGPIHYQELPELFMEYLSSLSGKSPSTTGHGSEGALTKGPFNALRPSADLNNALLAHILTGLAGFSTAAGHIGPRHQVDHDISLLVPELWCRLSPSERDPRFLIANGYLERVRDFTHQGRLIKASRLGWRITIKFLRNYFGRIFDIPGSVFDEAILRPETQDPEAFAEGVEHITAAQAGIARQYLEDGSVQEAVPPLRALLYILAEGEYQGWTEHDPEFREQFSPERVLASGWYLERLKRKQRQDCAAWARHVQYLEEFIGRGTHETEVTSLGLRQRLAAARERLGSAQSAEYLERLRGTLGAGW